MQLIGNQGTLTNFMVERDAYAKRYAVRKQADDLLEDRPTKIIYQGRVYTRDDVITAVAEHDLFKGAAIAAYKRNPEPMKDLMRRVAQFAICEHLFEGESKKLGFLP